MKGSSLSGFSSKEDLSSPETQIGFVVTKYATIWDGRKNSRRGGGGGGEFQAFFPVWLPIALLNIAKRNAMARPFLKANLIVVFLALLCLD